MGSAGVDEAGFEERVEVAGVAEVVRFGESFLHVVGFAVVDAAVAVEGFGGVGGAVGVGSAVRTARVARSSPSGAALGRAGNPPGLPRPLIPVLAPLLSVPTGWWLGWVMADPEVREVQGGRAGGRARCGCGS